jgi:diacylglycerol kinase (ATP)
MRIVLLANLNAKGLARHPDRLVAIDALCRDRARVLRSRDIAEVGPALRALDGVPDMIILAGGDGSYMAGVTALAQVFGEALPEITVGLLPVGTVGTIARNLGERGDPLAMLARWLDAPGALRAIPRTTLRIGADGVERIGFIFGTGLIANFFDEYESAGAGGTKIAAKIVARVFIESFRKQGGSLSRKILTPMPLSLFIEGKRAEPNAYSLLCASVLTDLGLSMRVNYRANEDPMRIHLVASSLEPRHLGPRMPYVILGQSIGGAGHIDQLIEHFAISFPQPDGAFVLDGDTFRARDVSVGIGPRVRIVSG